ncbi:hypothetical protein GAO09_15330 [Rhizobiales bacterium RZME27]|uniref:Uncharacterized protein n=1 Tax=Endobacterium cereale TaxID=2663029 RepID=A0A6A8A813_9HYPH|nr:hypothetical protein [Endobacterium cereale]MEB2847180.1 hypothetical protein [Endobacterium cereale]MQY47405.1 hypothetical protein [Endobacterium cereale]
MLEELFGGGKSSPPPSNNNNTQPTTQPSSPPTASEPTSGTTEPVDDETAEDDMVVDHDDGTYSPAPVTDENTPEEVESEVPADEPVASEPVNADEGEETDDENDSVSPSPVATTPAQPAPSNSETVAPVQPEAVVDDIAAAPAATRADPVTRITDLIATYEKLLSEPTADENGEARTRAMELAQNRVLTSLIDNLSASDAQAARAPLDEDTETDQVSLITKYYAEAGR